MKKIAKLVKKSGSWMSHNPRYRIVLVAAIFAIAGVTALVLVRAAGPSISIDLCENTPVQGEAYIGHDHPNTSCGHYVSFGYNPPTNVTAAMSPAATGIERPVDMASSKVPGDKRLFIASELGKIHISYNNDGSSVSNNVFLDLSSKVRYDGNEQGLLGLTFDPNYASNGYFYVSYVPNSYKGNFNGQNVDYGDRIISRFTRSSTNANAADPNSEMVIMGWDMPAANHNGGALQFGRDGYLYISTGDGGGGGDNHGDNCGYGNGQCLNTILGKILRVDVNGASTAQRYKIPNGNPFVGRGKSEIWHYGLRNPWRFSFDRKTGDMFIGDVGQENWEEVDFAANGVSGKNFGWRCFEGTHTYNTGGGASCSGLTGPIYEYDSNNDGCSVSGGYVYRGAKFPEFDGIYIFSDFCKSNLRLLAKNVNGSWSLKQTITTNLTNISAFGEDIDGELYVAALPAKTVYRINISHQ